MKSPDEGASPRRTSRSRSRLRPRASRLWTVPSGQVPHPFRRLFLSASFHINEHHRLPESLGKSIQLLEELWAGFRRACRFEAFGDHYSAPMLERAAARGVYLGPHRDAASHAIQPARRRIFAPDRARPPRKNEKRRLKRVLSVMAVAEHALARAKDHRPVSRDERGERRLGQIAAADQELFQELPVRKSGHRPRSREIIDVSQGRGITWNARHSSALVSNRFSHSVPTNRPNYSHFFQISFLDPIGNRWFRSAQHSLEGTLTAPERRLRKFLITPRLRRKTS